MILFWVVCTILIVIALAFVLPTALQRASDNQNSDIERREANVAIYRDQLEELRSDLKNGIVSQEQFDADHLSRPGEENPET